MKKTIILSSLLFLFILSATASPVSAAETTRSVRSIDSLSELVLRLRQTRANGLTDSEKHHILADISPSLASTLIHQSISKLPIVGEQSREIEIADGVSLFSSATDTPEETLTSPETKSNTKKIMAIGGTPVRMGSTLQASVVGT